MCGNVEMPADGNACSRHAAVVAGALLCVFFFIDALARLSPIRCMMLLSKDRDDAQQAL